MKTFILIACFIFNYGVLVAQTFVQGRVVSSETGKPVAAAILSSMDGKTLGISDSVGNFNFISTLNEFQVAHLAHFTKKIHINQLLTQPTIELEPLQHLLEEVKVYTGYQALSRERATGSFSYVDNETFNEQISVDVLSRLEAVANGLNVERISNVGSDNGLRVRGVSTFTMGAIREPLVILDNFPYEGDLNNINPNDVLGVTILKDAAATSVWGARAGNGVIVITTKQGKADQPLNVEIATNILLSTKPDLRYYQIMSGAEFLEMEKFLFQHQYRFSDTASNLRPVFSPGYEILFRQHNGQISIERADELLSSLQKENVLQEYNRHVYGSGFNQQYALSLNGGTRWHGWYFSSAYDHDRDELRASFERFNLRFQNTFKPTDRVTLQTGIYYANTKAESGRTPYSLSGGLPAYTRLASEEGKALVAPRDFRQPFLDTLGGGRLLDWNYYPMLDGTNQRNDVKTNSALVTFGVNYRFLSWVNFDAKYQFENQLVEREQVYGQDSYFTRNLVNQFSRLEGDEVHYNIPRGSVLDRSGDNMVANNFRGVINIDRAWDNQSIIALLGGEVRSKSFRSATNRTYGYNESILTFSDVDYLSRYPHVVTGNLFFIPNPAQLARLTNRFVSGFGNLAYSILDRYTATASVRRDASNLFGVNTNDKWNLLWSVGASWNLAAEKFYKFELVPHLRIRGTYGFSGNIDPNRSAVTTLRYSASASPFTGGPLAVVSQHSNPDLRWERVKMYNLALDFGVTNQVVSGNIDFFWKTASDLFGPDPVDYTTGISGNITRNVGSLKGHGFDLELHTRNLDRKIKWSSILNLSLYKDEVVSYNRTTFRGSALVTSPSRPQTLVEGRPLYSMYSYRWHGLDSLTGNPIGYVNGELSQDYNALYGAQTQIDDLVFAGSSIPVIYGSIGNTFRLGPASLTFRILFKFDYYIRNSGIDYSQLYAQGTGMHSEFANRWQQPGDESQSNVPSMVFPANPNRDFFYLHSTAKVERGDHIRIQYVNLAYDLAKGGRFLGFGKSARILINVNNIGLIWKANKIGLDPEYLQLSVPPPTNFGVGLKINM